MVVMGLMVAMVGWNWRWHMVGFRCGMIGGRCRVIGCRCGVIGSGISRCGVVFLGVVNFGLDVMWDVVN